MQGSHGREGREVTRFLREREGRSMRKKLAESATKTKE